MEIVRDTYIRIACTRTRNSICVRARERERKQGEPERHVGWHGEYGDRKAYPWGVDKIIIGPIIVPSTSRGGFFRSTMQLHFCAFNIIRALSHIQPSPSLNARPLVCPRPSSPHTRAHTPLIGRVLDGSPRGRGGRGWQREISKRLGWLLIIVLLNRKKGSPAIILPAYDVLSFVCHGHCDILRRR